jgi:hypothetical protein
MPHTYSYKKPIREWEEHMPSMFKALGSIPSMKQTNKQNLQGFLYL